MSFCRVVEGTTSIAEADLLNSTDGMFDKLAVGVNGSWPPPILNVNQGDTIRVHATNHLSGPAGTASVHHHGIFFNGTGYYDGAPGITQCGIPTNQTLTYEVPVDDQVSLGTAFRPEVERRAPNFELS